MCRKSSGQGFQIIQITQITDQLQIERITGDRAERTYLARLRRSLRPRHGAAITSAGAMSLTESMRLPYLGPGAITNTCVSGCERSVAHALQELVAEASIPTCLGRALPIWIVTSFVF